MVKEARSAADSGGEKRKARCVMATDSEWRRISERAEAAGKTISRFVVERLLDPPRDDGPLPVSLQRRMARDVLVLSRIEELRYGEAGAVEDWNGIVAAADAEIAEEERWRGPGSTA